MTRTRPQIAVLAALVLGTTVVLVAWLVLLLQADPLPSDSEISLRRTPVGATGRPSNDLRPATSDDPEGPSHAVRQPLPTREPERQGPVSVIGRVLERGTNKPVASFQVDVIPHAEGSPLDRLADSVSTPFHRQSGIFEVPKQAGRWDVVVRAPGYLPATLSDVTLPAVDHKPIDIPVDRGDGIDGLAVDRTDGLPLANIKVFLAVESLDDPSAPRPRISVAQTGLDGRFSFSPLPAGQYAVTLLEPDNSDDRVGAIRVRAGGGAVEVAVWMQPRHQVQIIVNDPRGRAVSGVRIDLRSDSHFASGSTNSTGTVVLDHVPDGTFTASASRRGYEDTREEIELYGGQGHSVHWLVLQPTSDG